MWLLVVNQSAGKQQGSVLARKFSKLIEQNNQKFHLINESSALDTDKKLGSLLETGEFSKVIAFGGDGLVHLCIQHIVQTNITFGIVPAGTGNDFSRTIGAHKKSITELFNYYDQNPAKMVDVGQITSPKHAIYFVQVLSTGFDALVNSHANKFNWPKGKFKYSLAMLFTLKKFRPIEYLFDIDGRSYSKNAMLLAIANGPCYGGGMKINPTAINSDGILDVLLVEPVSRVKLLALFPRIFSGSHVHHPKVSLMSGKVISLDAKTVSYADGEFVSSLPIKVSVVPSALRTWIIK
jgi:diacylglycerol kinase (ATP)